MIRLFEIIQNFDIKLLSIINKDRNHIFDNFFIFISNSIEYLVFIIPLFFLIYYLIKKQKKSLFDFYFISINLIITAIIITIIKYVVDRPRPYAIYEFIEKISVGGSPSFPSGHTGDAFAIAFGALFIFKQKLYSIPIFIWAILVGYSRMHTGVHYPSDVVFGIIVSFFITLISFKLYLKNIK